MLNAKVEENKVHFPTNYRTNARIPGDPELINEAARLLKDAKRPVVMAGSDVWWTEGAATLREFIETIKAPVFLNGMGRGSISPDHPQFGAQSRRFALTQADLVLLIGVPIDFRMSFGRNTLIPDETKLIHIMSDPREIGRNRGNDVGLVGNARLIMEQILDALPGAGFEASGDWVEKVHEDEMGFRTHDLELMETNQSPIHPMRLVGEIRKFLDRDATVVGDGGDIVTFGARVIPIHEPGHWLDPGQFGCLGVGTGFAMAAQLARPGKQILLLNGDGGFGLNGMDMETMVRFKLPVVSVVANNGGWGADDPRREARLWPRPRLRPLAGDPIRQDRRGDGRIRRARRKARGHPPCPRTRLRLRPPRLLGRRHRPRDQLRHDARQVAAPHLLGEAKHRMPHVEVNGFKMYYESQGSGHPVVFVHGHTLDGRIFDDVVPVVAKYYRAIRIDLRGHGRSEAPDGEYSWKAFGRDLSAFIETMGLVKPSLVGHSVGSTVIMEHLFNNPAAPQTVVFMAAGVSGDAISANLQKYMKEQAERFRRVGKTDEWVEGRVKNMVWEGTPDYAVKEARVRAMVDACRARAGTSSPARPGTTARRRGNGSSPARFRSPPSWRWASTTAGPFRRARSTSPSISPSSAARCCPRPDT